MLMEARHLADIQICQAMLQGNDLSSVLGKTLHGDGMTKYHSHYQNFQVNTAERVPLSVGLIEIVDQDAETVLSVLKGRILEIAQAICNQKVVTDNVTETVDKLLCSVKNTMSD